MSELKAIRGGDIHDDVEFVYDDEDRASVLYYLKSEADKVIADLEESHKKEVEQLLIEIVKLNEGSQNLILDNYLKDKEARHSNYKRCLAMADACRGNFLVAEHMIEKEPKNLMWHKRHKHYGRWMMLWRCFAEKFKPNSTAR